LIVHGCFYTSESTKVFMIALEQALLKRGLPRKIYVDYTGKKQMPKFAQILFLGQEITLKTSA